MKNLSVIILLALFSLTAFAQKPKPMPKTSKKLTSTTKKLSNEKPKPVPKTSKTKKLDSKKPEPAPKPSKKSTSITRKLGSEKPKSKPKTSKTRKLGSEEEFEKAVALVDADERIAALKKFVEYFPNSEEKIHALELVVIARATLADEKLRAGDAAGGIEVFKLAVGEAPKPASDKLFTEALLLIPNNLFFRGERTAAIEVARLIEEKADGNAKQILALATFYLGMENAAEAKRLADKAVQLEPNLPAAYQTLGIAHRLNFGLEESANAYTKALELDANSVVSKRSLAEMKRATGKPLEAATLYREILAKDEADVAARTGLILALFDAESKTEAEAQMKESLVANPKNLSLLVGAAYWYAAHEEMGKAVEFAEKAIAVEPRYTWAHIALARGLLGQKRPLEAEKALLVAKQYGSFPTLDYELATVKLAAGFYREAAEDLLKNFTVKDGLIETKLGGRVAASAENFVKLLSLERRAGIFQTAAADNAENAERLKSLLDFSQKLESSAVDETAIASAADEFVKGEDKMKLHRQLFIANRLLSKKSNFPKISELTKAAIGGVDEALSLPNSASAVLADELYESRKLAVARSEVIIVPEVSRQTLSNILRGRIEDITGWALFQESKTAESVVRLKRAVSILPEKSAWWRASMWRLGSALEADGKFEDALDAYIKSYTNSQADAVKYSIVESVYQKVNGNLDGLEARIGAKPASIASSFPVQIEQTVAQKSEKEIPKVEPTPKIKLTTETKPTIEVIPNQPTPTAIEPAPAPETKIEESAAPDKEKVVTKKDEPAQSSTTQPSPKSLFDPIIINVPKVEAKETEANPKETSTAETKVTELKQEETSSGKNTESRPRMAIEKEVEQTPPCKLVVSRENVSILNNRGSLGMLVGFEDEGDLKEITVVSSSPNDVAVVSETSIEALSSQILFVIKSISQKTGEFTVTFEAPCGKKEILVKVR
ncbi:MAG: hypothetical protein M3388_13530 [Acidobacteriota bacterium]|nr:hypothetical protein [Acidobacteriota bacterium]